MCGIFGYWGFQEEGLLRRMGDVLVHRGPDDEGFFEHDRLHMGMRRLSIIDLSTGHQPIYNEDKTLAVVFNGEIYNYVELIEELKGLGHRFATHSDTEAIVHAYEQWGLDCLDRFNGMFAFALYDLRNGDLIIARDRAGQKPLYYTQAGGKFLFASELKAILESAHVERRVNTSAIDSYLALRYVPNPQTLFEGIHCLPAAHWLTLKNGNLTIRRYWGIKLHEGRFGTDEYYRDRYDEVFTDAVRLTMRSDVPFGAYLSGGIDSSVVVAAMARMTGQVKTFSIGFDSPVDETHQARELAGRLKCDHHEVICRPEDFSLLPKAVWHLERPIGDALILAYYLLARETAKHVKVVLSGEGADELFAGYQFHKIIALTEAYTNAVPGFLTQKMVVPALANIPVGLLGKLFIYPAALGDKGKERVVDYLRGYGGRTLNENYIHLRSLFARSDREALYSEGFRKSATEDWIRRTDGYENGRRSGNHLLERLLRLQFDDWLQDNLLLRQDANTMAHSLELRCPFLDHRLIELAFAMPARMKVRRLADKFVEREWARKVLPKGNVARSKNPFYLPMEYFHGRREVKDLMGLTLNPEAVRRRGYFDPAAVGSLVEKMQGGEFLYIKQVMALVILELWHMIFIDKQKMW